MKNLSAIAKQNKKLSLAVISLLLAILILSTASFSWIEGSRNGKVNDDASSVSAGDGLYFTDINGNMIKEIVFPQITLEDCTSKDGRNFFFPTSESKVDSSASTESMVYRAGTEADKNTKYISQDFNIVSYSQSDLFIDTVKSKITCDNGDVLKALRLSINFNDGTEPIVISPANVTGYKRYSNPVTAINADGSAAETANETMAYALKDYSVSANKPLTSFSGDETKRVTINMWLEGTDYLGTEKSCVTGKISSDAISVNLVFSTASEYTKTITFVDYSPNSWVADVAEGGGNVKMFVLDKADHTDTKYTEWDRYEMAVDADGITYTVKVPETVNDVIFGRFDPDYPDKDYNYWGTTQSMTDGDLNKYYAIGNGKSVDGVNYGYWVQSSCAGVVDIELTEMPLLNEVQFTCPSGWNNLHAYFFYRPASGSDVEKSAAWPGNTGTWVESSNYKFTIPDGANYVVFNNGEGSYQTVDISLGEAKGYYTTGTKSGDKYEVYYWGTRENQSSPGIFAYKDSTKDYKPNIYFNCSTYNSALSNITFTDSNGNVASGVFNPNTAFDSGTNYGFTMYQPDTSQRVYRMILPADSTIMFNGGQGGKSDTLTLSGSSYKIKFYSASDYVNY